MIATFFKKHHEKIKYYDTITGASTILRRYFVMNAFDGSLIMLGVLLGSMFASVSDPALVLKIGVATSVAVGVSGLTGALFTEHAERAREIHSMERALHRKLDNTEFKRAYESASVLIAVVNGLSPLIAAMVIMLPFFLATPDGISIAYYSAIALALSVFFLLGVFLGRISRDSALLTGIKLVLAGIFCMAVIYALESVH